MTNQEMHIYRYVQLHIIIFHQYVSVTTTTTTAMNIGMLRTTKRQANSTPLDLLARHLQGLLAEEIALHMLNGHTK
jgi:hypothetical protein